MGLENIKHDRIGKTPITDSAGFETGVASALHRLQKQANKIRGFSPTPLSSAYHRRTYSMSTGGAPHTRQPFPVRLPAWQRY
jgi:hypothetical protein